MARKHAVTMILELCGLIIYLPFLMFLNEKAPGIVAEIPVAFPKGDLAKALGRRA